MATLEEIRAAAVAYDTARRTARAEAAALASLKVKEQYIALQRLVWEGLQTFTPSRIADECGIGRSTVYKYRDEYSLIAPATVEVAAKIRVSGKNITFHIEEFLWPTTKFTWESKERGSGEGWIGWDKGGVQYWAQSFEAKPRFAPYGDEVYAALIREMDKIKPERGAAPEVKGWGEND